MAARMLKSASVPGLLKLGTEMPRVGDQFRKTTLAFRPAGAVDLQKGAPPCEEAQVAAEFLRVPAWRQAATEPAPLGPPMVEDIVPRNMRHPRLAPAWLKHDKQVLRFYAFFQESVVERWDENCRYRNVIVMYHMEDGTIRVQEPKVENSGIPQGLFLRRHRVPRPDGTGLVGPDDFHIGEDITIYGRTYHITGCDRFTRWFYEENGIDVGEDEPLLQDQWQKVYKFRKVVERGGVPMTKSAAEAKVLMKLQIGETPQTKKLVQFLLNDRKVLRFKVYWDDPTMYGTRVYLEINYHLADNTAEINEALCRNAGRDSWPVFMKRGPLFKNCDISLPGLLVSERARYQPEDFVVGEPITVWNRTLMIYDCDEFTRKFYLGFLGIDQFEGKIDVSEKPLLHRKLAPPPHNGIGSEEDSLISCQMIQPKPHKVDVVKLMTLTGECLRFECVIDHAEPEDESRKFIVAFYPADDNIAVFEVQQRNSGHMGGKFADKRKRKNPDTGKYWALNDLYVGGTATVSSQIFRVIRADEHCLQYLEARPELYPWADPVACVRRLAPIADEPELQDEAGVDPDRLKELAEAAGVDLIDHEVITLLRRYSIAGQDGPPRVSGPRVVEALGEFGG